MIDARHVLDDVELGASIAVNGCCLTVVAFDDDSWAADAVIETLARTNLGDLAAGDPVNLERPVRLADRLGGHLVQGHVDATGTVRDRDAAARRLRARHVRRARRGAALRRAQGLDHRRRRQPHRRARCDDDGFAVALIPHTLAVTTLGARARRRDRVQPRGRSDRQVRRALLVPTRSERHAMTFDEVERAIDAVKRGEFVVVVDDEDRENEGDLIIAADRR